MKYSETGTQISTETQFEVFTNELRRSKGKRLAYLKNRWQWKYWPRNKVPDFPLNIDIESSSQCQIACDHCFRQYMPMNEDEHMSLDLFKKIAKECGEHGLFTLKFSMRGEPLLNPHIVEMVAYAKQCGIKEVWINTNGGKLSEELSRELMRAKVDWITMSFDGLRDVYESVRRPLKYNKQIERLRALRKARDELHPDCNLNVQTIWSAIKDNPEEYVTLMKGIVDRVAINPDMDFEDFILEPDDEFVCPRLWQRMAITSTGNYLKCPSDFEMEEIMGNAWDMGVKEAWDILQGRQRELHLSGHKKDSEVCQKCHHGAKKVPVKVSVPGADEVVPQYTYTENFDGFGGETRVKEYHDHTAEHLARMRERNHELGRNKRKKESADRPAG